MKRVLVTVFLLIGSIKLFADPRSFDDIFPGLDKDIRARVFSNSVYLASFEKKTTYRLLSAPGLDGQISNKIVMSRPTVLIESLALIPYDRGNPLELVDIYNSIRNIRGLKGRLYHSATRDADVPLFEDATRIEGQNKTRPIQDPAPKSSMPEGETIYIRLKDLNFGNSYYRGDIELNRYGFLYTLSNYRDLTYLLFPVIKAEKFTVRFYFEPLREGILIYSISGADVSDFIASKIDIPSAIQKRLDVIFSWMNDGIRNTIPPGTG
ncbi:MAG: hypothetical protein LBF77_01475 [Spirochaetaceae bacterium]|nr:hypothetical protein [Spirochaetaceae bacterium]